MNEPAWLKSKELREPMGAFTGPRARAAHRKAPAQRTPEAAPFAVVEGVGVSEAVLRNLVAFLDDHTDRSPRASGCWIWTGSKDTGGYGVVVVREILKKAHRVVYDLAKGPIPKGLFLRHGDTCESRACIHPSHLQAGTPRQNFEDAMRLGRAVPIAVGRQGILPWTNCGKAGEEKVSDFASRLLLPVDDGDGRK